MSITEEGVLSLPFGIGEVGLSASGNKASGQNEKFRLEIEKRDSLAYRYEPISWNNDTVELRGGLYLPAGTGPFPTIVLAHGASAGNRQNWNYRSWAGFYLEQGFGLLLYDRRGEGASGGVNNDHTTFIDLKEDLLLGLQHISEHPEVDTSRLGIGGGSQAAYLGLMAAAESSLPRFLIHSGASAVPIDQQEMDMVWYEMREQGEPWAYIREAEAYLRLLFHYVTTGRNWETLRKEAEWARSRPWGHYIGHSESEEGLLWWRRNVDIYRPEEALPKIGIPALFLYGEEDVIVPPLENAPKLEYYLSQNPAADFRIQVFPNCGHNLEVGAYVDEEGRFHWFEKHPEMRAQIRRFCRQLRE